jgi:hypothetical protein
MSTSKLRVHLWIAGAGLLGCSLLAAGQAWAAANLAMDITDLNGNTHVDGDLVLDKSPHAIALTSVQFQKNGTLIDTRRVDSSTPTLTQDLLLSHPLDVEVVLYKSGPSENSTVLTIDYRPTLLSSQQILGPQNAQTETDTFTGSSGRSKIKIKVKVANNSGGSDDRVTFDTDNVDVDDGSLVVSRTVDAETPVILGAFSAGGSLSGDLLFYDASGNLTDEPISFTGLSLTSQVYDPLGGLGSPETDTFSFADVQAVPEPASTILALSGIGLLIVWRTGPKRLSTTRTHTRARAG